MASFNWPLTGGGGSPYWGDAVATAANLPASGAVVGEIRLVLDTDDQYEWNGTTWERVTQNSADVTGPGSATDNAVARFDGTTGKLLQNSGVTVDDSGGLTAASLTTAGALQAASATVGTLAGVVKASAGALSASAVGLASSDVSGTLPVANGGTGSNAALSDNRVMRSSGGAIVVASAITAARAVISDADGIPTHSTVTATELAALSGIDSNVQDQIDGKLNLSGGTMTGALNAHAGVDVDGFDETTLNIGTANADVINIGRSGAQVNLQGTTAFQNVTNYEVADKNITVNKGGAASSATSAGLEVEEDSTITAYARTSVDRASWVLKAPATAGVATIAPGAGGITLDQDSHDPVTIGTANGLSLADQALSMAAAGSGVTGALTSSEWARFDSRRATEGNVAVASNVTLTDRRIHFVDTSSARTLTLPAPSATLYLVLKDVTGSAGTNNVTISPAGAQTIDGAATLLLDMHYQAVTIVSDGTNYYVI